MTRLRHDDALPLPAPPGGIPRLGAEAPALALAGAAAGASFLVEGEAASAHGPEAGAVAEVRIGGHLVAAGLEADVGAVANVVASPGVLRRERISHTGTVMETLLAAPTLPLLAVQWCAPDPAGTVQVAAGVTLAPGAGSCRYRARGGTLVLSAAEAPDRIIALLFDPPPEELTVVEAPGGGAGVSLVLPPTGVATLAVAAGGPARVRVAATALGGLGAHERAAQAPPGGGGGLLLRTGVPELDEGAAWARARLARAVARSRAAQAPPPAETAFWWGVGAAAAGDLPTAADAAALLGRSGPAAPWAGLLGEGLARAGGPTPPRPARADGGPLQGSVAAAAEGGAGGRRSLRLPMAGERAAPGDAAALAAWLLTGGADPPRRPDDGWLAAWHDLVSGRATAGYAAWRERLAHALGPAAAVRGAWDAPDADGPGAARLLATLVHGVLGWAPDAQVGRAVLAPRFPRHLGAFTVGGLAMADVRVGLAYRKEGDRVRFRVRPEGGRIPPMLVLKPRVEAPAVGRTWVDGAEADLAVTPLGEGAHAVPVQLPLDTERTLEIELLP